MITNSRRAGFLLAGVAGMILLAACAKSSPSAAPPPSASSAPPSASPSPSPSPSPSASPPVSTGGPVVGTRSIAGIGVVLTNRKGLTLYHLTTDSSTMTTCTGGCALTWPPLLTANGKVPSLSGVKGTFATMTRPDGSEQVTFKGMPLYTYAGDMAAGQAHGQGIGGVWFAVIA